MARVSFTYYLQGHVPSPPVEVDGATVGEVLAGVFQTNPRARSYVLDDQGAVRRHIVVFLNGRPIRDRVQLSDPVPPDADLFVMQALSGG